VKLNVRKGDKVVVITGKDAGKQGKIIEVDPKRNRVIVEGVNVVKRHSRPTRKLPQGGIQEKEAPISRSNVMLICGRCHKPTRVGKRILDDGSKVRICKKCGEAL
jgi:large subunit ribosomal protein L24